MPRQKRIRAVALVLTVALTIAAVPTATAQVSSSDLGAAHGGWGEIGDEVVAGAAIGIGAAGCVASGGTLCGAAAGAAFLAQQATDGDKNDGLNVPS